MMKKYKIKEDKKPAEQLNYVYECLQRAKLHDLDTEVVVYALEAMKADPKISIQTAMDIGMGEWDI